MTEDQFKQRLIDLCVEAEVFISFKDEDEHEDPQEYQDACVEFASRYNLTHWTFDIRDLDDQIILALRDSRK